MVPNPFDVPEKNCLAEAQFLSDFKNRSSLLFCRSCSTPSLIRSLVIPKHFGSVHLGKTEVKVTSPLSLSETLSSFSLSKAVASPLLFLVWLCSSTISPLLSLLSSDSSINLNQN